MFEGFETGRFHHDGAEIHYRRGGEGPPLLLLHGYPQCHVMWHRLAPLLRTRFTLVMPDTRGYGDSRGPGPDDGHLGHSKRVMAADMVALMADLGHQEFCLAGHDRGARVAYRLCLDWPGRVRRFVALDTVPTDDVWAATDKTRALGAFHWPFLAQPAPLPERLIGGDPDFFVTHLLDRWAGSPGILDAEAVQAYVAAHRKPAVIEAMAEDYRAGAGIDHAHDRADRAAGRRIDCPLLVIWGSRYTKASPLATWRGWADAVSERELDCGHFVAEEMPEACAEAMLTFLGKPKP